MPLTQIIWWRQTEHLKAKYKDIYSLIVVPFSIDIDIDIGIDKEIINNLFKCYDTTTTFSCA